MPAASAEGTGARRAPAVGRSANFLPRRLIGLSWRCRLGRGLGCRRRIRLALAGAGRMRSCRAGSWCRWCRHCRSRLARNHADGGRCLVYTVPPGSSWAACPRGASAGTGRRACLSSRWCRQCRGPIRASRTAATDAAVEVGAARTAVGRRADGTPDRAVANAAIVAGLAAVRAALRRARTGVGGTAADAAREARAARAAVGVVTDRGSHPRSKPGGAYRWCRRSARLRYSDGGKRHAQSACRGD